MKTPAELAHAIRRSLDDPDNRDFRIAGFACLSELRALAEQRDKLAEALKFYANERNWTQPAPWGGQIFDDEAPAVDCGRHARAAMAPSLEETRAAMRRDRTP